MRESASPPIDTSYFRAGLMTIQAHSAPLWTGPFSERVTWEVEADAGATSPVGDDMLTNRICSLNAKKYGFIERASRVTGV